MTCSDSMFIQATVFDEIKQAQKGGAEVERIKVNTCKGKLLGFNEDEHGL